MSTDTPETEPEETTGTEKKNGFFTVHLPGRKPKVVTLMRDELAWGQLLMLIRQGVFDHTAAQAIGVGSSTWYRWMAQGERDHNLGDHTHVREFWEKVSAARAQARVTKELQVGQMDPRFWLRNGPGKTKRNNPGWTDNIAVVGDDEADPLRIEGEFVAAVGFEDPAPTDLAQTLAALAQLGFLVGANASAALKAGGQSPLLPENYDDEDVVDATAKGYDPDRGLNSDEVETIGPDNVLLSDQLPEMYQ